MYYYKQASLKTALSMAETKEKKKQAEAPKAVEKKPVFGRRVEIGLLVAVLLLTLGLRLIRIDSPLLDFHANRQTQTASNTQGFAEHTLNLFKPTFLLIDADGNAPGVTEMEFPIYQYILGLLARVVGMHDFMGRLFSTFLGVGVGAYTYLLARRYFGIIAALGAAVAYAISPVAVYYNRSFQPDTLALLGFIAGIYHLAVWFDERQKSQAIAAAALTALSLLIKPPIVLIIVPWIAYELIKRNLWRKDQRRDFLVFIGAAAFVVVATAAWYIFTDIFIFRETGLTMLRGKVGEPIGTTEYWFSAPLYIELFWRIILMLTPIGAAVLAAAFIPMNRTKHGPMMTTLFAGCLIYFIVVAEYNLPHFYYQLPFIPIMSIIVGWAFSWAVAGVNKNKAAQLLVPTALIIAWGGTAALSLFAANPWYNIDDAPFFMDSAAKVKAIVGPKARIVANDMFFCEFHYYADSYKPHVSYSKETGEFVSLHGVEEAARDFGVEYVVWLKYADWTAKDNLPEGSELLADESYFSLWRLPAPTEN